MKRHSAWAVAAAILIQDRKSMHYTELADKVMHTNLTGLSDEGGSTPEQTMGSAIRAHYGIFEQNLPDAGCYYIEDRGAAMRDPKVRAAFEALQRQS